MSKPLWLIRAGEDERKFVEFIRESVASVGFTEIGPLAEGVAEAEVRQIARKEITKAPRWYRGATSVFRFLSEVAIDDEVVTYTSKDAEGVPARSFVLGRITGSYQWREDRLHEHPRHRAAVWTQVASKDALSEESNWEIGKSGNRFVSVRLLSDSTADDLRHCARPLEDEDSGDL